MGSGGDGSDHAHDVADLVRNWIRGLAQLGVQAA